jgi:hypothetical protein
MMTMMVAVRSARSLAGLLQILLEGGEIGLLSPEVARFQILRELRNGGTQRAALRAGSRRQQRALLSTGKKRLKRREIALRLGQVSRKQIQAELLKASLELLFVGTRRGCGTNLAENAGNPPKIPIRVSSFQAARGRV